MFRRRDRWSELFPLPESPDVAQTDAGFVRGVWEFDEVKTVKVLQQLGRWDDKEKADLETRRKLIGLPGYRFSARSRERLNRGEVSLLEPSREIIKWQRNGNRVTIQHRKGEGKIVTTEEFWCDGESLVERNGWAYKRVGNFSSKA